MSDLTAREIEQQILTLVESSIEDTRVPDAIAAHADKRAGKTVTKIDADQLEAQLGVPVRIRRQHGMTHVAWAVGEGGNPWREERSILLGYSESGTRWPTGDALRAKEPAHFGARDERNEACRKLLAEHREAQRSDGQLAKLAFDLLVQAAHAYVEDAAHAAKLKLGAINYVGARHGAAGAESVVSRAAAAVAKIREAQAELEQLLDYGQPLHVVRFDVEKLAEKG